MMLLPLTASAVSKGKCSFTFWQQIHYFSCVWSEWGKAFDHESINSRITAHFEVTLKEKMLHVFFSSQIFLHRNMFLLYKSETCRNFPLIHLQSCVKYFSKSFYKLSSLCLSSTATLTHAFITPGSEYELLCTLQKVKKCFFAPKWKWGKKIISFCSPWFVVPRFCSRRSQNFLLVRWSQTTAWLVRHLEWLVVCVAVGGL